MTLLKTFNRIVIGKTWNLRTNINFNIMYAKAKNISVQTTYFAINTQFVIIVSS